MDFCLVKVPASEILEKLIKVFIVDPKKGRAIAERYNLWEPLYAEFWEPCLLKMAYNDVNIFIEQGFTDQNGNLLAQQSFQKEWQALITNYDQVLIAGPRSHGKCLAAGTKIRLPDGIEIAVEEFQLGKDFVCQSWLPDQGYTQQVGRVWQDSFQECYEVKTHSGRSTRVSKEHLFLTSGGWVAAKDIQKRETVAISAGNDVLVFWDEVVEVTFLGEQQTYSVEVDNTHVHITDDFVTHNTTQIVARIVWELGRNCNMRIKIIGSGDDKAKEIIGYVKTTIEKSEFSKKVFPELAIDSDAGDTKQAFFVKRTVIQRDPSVEASGVLSAGAGGRADLLIFDDVVDMKNAIINPAMREQVIKAVTETWLALAAAISKIVWICTPYHLLDCSHYLKKQGGWKVWWVPAIRQEPVCSSKGEQKLDRDGNPVFETVLLFPSLWSQERLDKRRGVIGERPFARQFLLQAMSDEERTFPDECLEKSYNYELSYIGEGIGDDWPTWGGVDVSSALGKRAAFNVIFTIAQNPANNKFRFKEIWRLRAKFPTVFKEVKEQYRKHKWCLVYVENNQYQDALITALKEDESEDAMLIPVEGFTTGAYNKADELIGLPGLALMFQRGMFEIPAKRFPLAVDDTSPLAVFMNEMTTHPGGEFSDTVMALWFASRAAMAGSKEFEDAYIAALAM